MGKEMLCVTCWWRKHPAAARYIGAGAGGILDCPFSTVFKDSPTAKKKKKGKPCGATTFLTVPGGFIILAGWRAVHWNRQDVPTRHWLNGEMGADDGDPSIPDDLWVVINDDQGLRLDWNFNSWGNPALPDINKIELKNKAAIVHHWTDEVREPDNKVPNQVDFGWWPYGTFQTVLWLGNSKPAKAGYYPPPKRRKPAEKSKPVKRWGKRKPQAWQYSRKKKGKRR